MTQFPPINPQELAEIMNDPMAAHPFYCELGRKGNQEGRAPAVASRRHRALVASQSSRAAPSRPKASITWRKALPFLAIIAIWAGTFYAIGRL